MTNGTFVLGVGAQKAGTTWLHSYLSGLDCVDLGLFKEYHILDARYIPECSHYKSDYNIKSYIKNIVKMAMDKKHVHRYSFQRDIDKYFDYFEDLLSRNKTINVTGDITPSYSGLPVEALETLQENFTRREIGVKVIFLLRDPLERCWSSVRMHRRRKKANFEEIDIQAREEDALRSYFKTRNAELRTRYDQTIQRVESVFDPKDLFVGFYETFLKDGSGEVDRLADFLGVDYAQPDYSRKFNVSKKSLDISDDLKTEIVAHYSDVYRFISDRYGRDFVNEIWGGAKYVE